MATIAITDVTQGTISGTGAFDKFVAAGKAHLLVEYDANRITAKEYATVYLGMLQSSMAQAVQFVLGKQVADKQADLLAQKTLTEVSQTVDPIGGVTKQQFDLIAAQTAGFTRDAEQKIAKIFADVYAMNIGALGAAATTPLALQDPDISAIMKAAAAGIGVTITDT